MKTGTATLPLHYGTIPRWLFEQMTKLAREISTVLIIEFGTEGFFRRISDPNWFQAFGCVLGFDWHSSGLTTTTCGALKEGLKPLEKDLKVFVCGGKGKSSRKTPKELEEIGQNFSFNVNPLIYASKISAKVDNNAVQDGYQLYHHNFFFDDKGRWAVIQQGMNSIGHWARRYHWLADNVQDFVNEPHTGIASENLGVKNSVLNLVAEKSFTNRKVTAKLSCENPKKLIKTIQKLKESKLPQRHQLLLSDINPENLKKIFLSTYEQKPENFEKLLGLPKVGPKTIRALALIAELVYGAQISTSDPARFSFAHGGKDGIPYPVDRKTYHQSIEYLASTINKANLGYYQKLHALRRLASML